MLQAIFGGGDQEKPGAKPKDGLVPTNDPEAVKALFMGLKAKHEG